jgi:glycosyltransferase involved in cell wall biosynthesis
VSGRLALLRATIGNRPSVLTALDAWHRNVEAQVAVSRGARRLLLRNEVRRVRRFEATTWPAFDRVVMVTEQDADGIRQLAPGALVDVITLGVELPDAAGAAIDQRRIIFHGVLRYPPNVSACERLARRVLPLVREHVPDARLVLVGREPSPQVRALDNLPGVEVTGAVPDTIPWLAGSRVYACAVDQGTGIKNKVLEAMAAGVPVVSTRLGLQGLDVQPDRDVLRADDDAGLASHIVAVLRDDTLAARLGRAGRAYVEANHRWSAVVDKYEALYREVLA